MTSFDPRAATRRGSTTSLAVLAALRDRARSRSSRSRAAARTPRRSRARARSACISLHLAAAAAGRSRALRPRRSGSPLIRPASGTSRRRAPCTGSRGSSRRRSGGSTRARRASGRRRSPTNGAAAQRAAARPAIGPRAGIPLLAALTTRSSRPHLAAWRRMLGGVVTVRSYQGEGHDVQYRHWDQILVDAAGPAGARSSVRMAPHDCGRRRARGAPRRRRHAGVVRLGGGPWTVRRPTRVELGTMISEVFVTCAVTGAGDTVGRSEHVPVTPGADRRVGDRRRAGRRRGRAHPRARPARPGAARASPRSTARWSSGSAPADVDPVLNLTAAWAATSCSAASESPLPLDPRRPTWPEPPSGWRTSRSCARRSARSTAGR